MDLHPGEEIVFEGGPVWRSILSFYLAGILVALLIAVIVGLIGNAGLGIAVWVGLVILILIAGLLKRIGTRYAITTQRLQIKRGILSRKVQQTRIDRVQNVNTRQSFIDRILRVGTVDFDTAGTDDSEFTFAGVGNPAAVVNAVDRAQREHATLQRAAGDAQQPGGL